MFKRIFLLFTLTVLCISLFANMSSPWLKGDATSEAYSSRDIDILHESLHIRIIDFNTAKFTVIYRIKSDRKGKQIPLIFDTMTRNYNSKGLFHIWVDDQEVTVSEIPSTYEDKMALIWLDSLDNHLLYSPDDVPNMIGLRYFEVNLSEGEHLIRVEYTAQSEIYLGNSVREFTLRYNLAPARFWRSFGGLDVEIDKTGLDGAFEINLPNKGSSLIDPVTHLHFTEIPADELTIVYKPRLGWFANIVIAAKEWLVLVFILLLCILHAYLVIRYRRKNPKKRFSPVVIIGSILAPALYISMYIWSYSVIDAIVGDHASRRHGYVFLTFIIYPVIMPVYFLLMWIIDKMKKDKMKKDVSA